MPSDEQGSVLGRMERQMSSRAGHIAVKSWEMTGLEQLVEHLMLLLPEASGFKFYYSFQIPKLGKEFDLLRISEDTVINIELKSKPVSDEQIQKQLEQNRYYLSTLGITIRSYTYISAVDRLVRLTNSGRIVETGWEELCNELAGQKHCYEGNIEELFKEERYIISPLDDPDRFLQNEYFLTSGQKDIKRRILKKIQAEGSCFQGFTGLPGTGKTLLLYDIAMKLSEKQKVCIFHCGAFSDELEHLNTRLKRIDFYDGKNGVSLPELDDYTAILADEAHRMEAAVLDHIVTNAVRLKIPVIFCYDSEKVISKKEFATDIVGRIEGLEGYAGYRLTNRIRTNSELSSFIQCVMQGTRMNHRKEYPSVSLLWANDAGEARKLINSYMADDFTFVYDDLIKDIGCGNNEVYLHDYTRITSPRSVEVYFSSRQEYDKVIMLMDDTFYYDSDGSLRARYEGDESPVRNLFHGLNRARKELAIVVLDNTDVFNVLMAVLQGVRKSGR